MRPARSALLFALALSVMLSARAERTTTLTIGTATPGGGFAAYGEALAETIRNIDPGLVLDLRATKGSGENVPLLEAGNLDFALVEGTIAFEALTGVGRTPANLPVIFAMYSSPGMFVVRGDATYRTVAHLKGKRVVFGAASSGLVVLARYILDGLGLDMGKDFEPVLLESAKDGPPMIIDGKAAALWGGGLGWPGFVAVARGPQRAHFIGLEIDDISRIQRKHPFLKALTVPAGSYPGQDYAINTVGA
jgi:TRAP transporter TAXI family solute receptor